MDLHVFLHLMQERFHDCAKLGKSTISRLKEYGNQIRESLQAEQSKSQQLEEKNKILAQDQAILQSEKIHLEQQVKIMQQDLDSKDLCQASDSTTQTSGSEHHETDSEVKLKSLRQQIQEMEQEHKRTEALLKTEIDPLRKKLQDNSANQRKACYSEHALAAHIKYIADNLIRPAVNKLISRHAPCPLLAAPTGRPPKTEIDHLRKKLQDNSANQRKACYSEHALAAHIKDIADSEFIYYQRRYKNNLELDQASCNQAYLQTRSVPTPGCSHW
ncbi:hypothetical protein AAFF_G00252870 [Aldrovandia affinis]|uniref:Uncharacterized protein n=1 Tax=Aldrovandia affinis TaxID=143900 RepID=A0AAD7SUZ6_9TELE|nr:hypothetical protein AAFF_G00252870 [Aldrovandia affinis]